MQNLAFGMSLVAYDPLYCSWPIYKLGVALASRNEDGVADFGALTFTLFASSI
jgi:hypothetical protein